MRMNLIRPAGGEHRKPGEREQDRGGGRQDQADDDQRHRKHETGGEEPELDRP